MNSTSVVKQYVCQNVVGWYLYIYDLFINVVSSSDHIGSIGRRITELKFMLKALTNDCSLIWDVVPVFTYRDGISHGNLHSG